MRSRRKPDADDRTVSDVLKEIELVSDVRTAVGQIERGEGIPNAKAKAELRRRFRR